MNAGSKREKRTGGNGEREGKKMKRKKEKTKEKAREIEDTLRERSHE